VDRLIHHAHILTFTGESYRLKNALIKNRIIKWKLLGGNIVYFSLQNYVLLYCKTQQGLNQYLYFIGKNELKLKQVKVQQKTYLDNVISNADYLYLKKSLKKDNNYKWYFIVWFLCATGARVGELTKIKIEHVQVGYIDVYAKGGKIRRLFIPKILREDALKWLEKEDRQSGVLFKNRSGKPLTTNGIARQLKYYAKKYGVEDHVVYPHSFRHLFAKNFLSKSNDIALLADLMGHDSIETTRIYLRKTMGEQREIVDNLIDW
jgi:integrase